MSRTQGVKPPTRYSHDPHFIAGAKEVLARKPFDYDGRRNDDSQERYENGRLIAIMIQLFLFNPRPHGSCSYAVNKSPDASSLCEEGIGGELSGE